MSISRGSAFGRCLNNRKNSGGTTAACRAVASAKVGVVPNMDATERVPPGSDLPTKIDIVARGILAKATLISLRRRGGRTLNACMKLKLLLSVAVIGSFVLGGAFAQAQKKEIIGKVVAVTATTITVQRANEKGVWEIKIGSGTKTTVTSDVKVGATVTVSYIQTNAQKKEAPL